ncbi:MAG: sodium-dependent transporter [Lachnospiraceae bacterium]|nr:sodium-dependent transporter [Lachnospiraceae bacterium]MBR5944197.1 sodium-dependent transporter [Lachnospiraceae bacterium]
MEQKSRENFGSRLGFILVSAGCAIGIGNVWKFPYVTGENGGAIFVLFYLLFLVIMGIPVLTMELAVGRASRKTVVGAYKSLEKEGHKWHLHGWLCVAGNYILMMYYTTVSGWMLSYFWKFLTGSFEAKGSDDIAGVFTDMLANPVEMTVFMGVVVVVGFLVLSFGVQNGLERVNKVMMIGLLGLIILLAVHSVTLPGGGEGIKFYLLPSIANVQKAGLGKVITAAMNQSFFTLSLGIASMEVFGSYMSKEHSLTGEAVRICALDTGVALISGLIIFPACFSFGIEPAQGPSLIFVTLPSVFLDMAGGRIWGTLFFLFMTFASFSTVTAVFENIVGSSIDNFKWSRIKSVIVNGVFMLVASLPCVFGYNIWSTLRLIGDRDVLDSEDFIVSNLLLPIGSLIFLLFCVTKLGWGADKYLDEVNTGKGTRMSAKLLPYYKFILPVLILIILITGLI